MDNELRNYLISFDEDESRNADIERIIELLEKMNQYTNGLSLYPHWGYFPHYSSYPIAPTHDWYYEDNSLTRRPDFKG